MTLRPDSRISDVLHIVYDPEEYVRGILDNFYRWEFSKDKAVVRIGVSGNGHAAHHCIEQGTSTMPLPDLGVEIEGFETRGVYHGRSHTPTLEDQFMGISWSSCATTFREVRLLSA